MLATLKEDIKTAMKERNTLKRDVLKYIVATVESSPPNCHNDGYAQKIILKTIENNKALLAVRPDDKLSNENEILSSYLPTALNLEPLKDGITSAISAAKSEGQAVGLAMKWLKSEGHDISTSGELIKNFVKEIFN